MIVGSLETTSMIDGSGQRLMRKFQKYNQANALPVSEVFKL